ncbi:MAG: dihydroorotate dehydrogenase electron transfer subunit [Atopobiaceae bacterium]|nr:dihydroorotate dehydrogenase electron transfer subunit [Atopobiaceae bacterium]
MEATTGIGLHEATVLANEPCAQGTMRMTIHAPGLARAIQPGQFMNLEVLGDPSHILRIPLSFSCADADAGTVTLIYAVVGKGTERLSPLGKGASLSVTGPCGRGWKLPSSEGRVLLVAGGAGLPPILAAARMLATAGVGFDAVIGARTYALHVFPECDGILSIGDGYDADRLVILTTDDGSRAEGAGRGMLVTDGMADLFAEREYAQVITCGPSPMMAAVVAMCREKGIPCQVSLERMMGCGFGACSCCNVALVAGGYALCCKDGPVFDASEVAW